MLKVEKLSIPNVKKIIQLPPCHDEIMTGQAITWLWWVFRKVIDPNMKPIISETEIVMERALSLRGMYYTIPPRTNALFIRVFSGSVYVNVLDLREGSKTYGKSVGCELSSEAKEQIYVPENFAWGILSLSDNTVLICKSTNYISNKFTCILNYADPTLNIQWPQEPVFISPIVKFAPGINEIEAQMQLNLMETQVSNDVFS